MAHSIMKSKNGGRDKTQDPQNIAKEIWFVDF